MGRVTRVAEFGAFAELEPGIEALAHVSTFAPTGRKEEWSTLVAPGTTAAFEIVIIDLEKKRIGVALVPEGSARAKGSTPSQSSDAGQGDADADRDETAAPERLGSLADQLRGALTRREP